VFGINIAPLSSVHSSIGSMSSKKGDETMHREPLNQEMLNTFNFMIIPIVVVIVFFLIVQPCSDASSSCVGVSNLFACLFCP